MGRNEGTGGTAHTAARESSERSRSTQLNDPFVVSVAGLRGLPSARTAAILAAYAYQPDGDLEGPRGPAADTVERFSAARRLEGWAVWLQLGECAALIRQWDAHPFDEDDPEPHLIDPALGGVPDEQDEPYVNRVERADPALHERLIDQLNRVQARTPRAVDTRDMTDQFVAAEVALASGLTRGAADGRVLAARVLLVNGELPRVAALARAGFLDWPKLSLLVARLVTLGPVLGPAIERCLIPDADLVVATGSAEGEPCLEVLADPARPGATLPGVSRMSGYRLEAAITGLEVALDPEGAKERAAKARAMRCVRTRTDPDGMARLEASTGQEDIAAAWNALTDAARQARRHGDPRTLDQIRLDELIRRTTGTATGPNPGTAAGGVTSAAGEDTGDGGVSGTASSGAAGTTGAAASGDPAVRTARWTVDRRTSVSLLMPLDTYLGIAEDPCALDGYGPIPAELARRIAADAVRDHPVSTTWRCVITDGEHGQHTSVVGLTRPVRITTATSTSTPVPAHVFNPETGVPLSTPKHDPPEQLTELMRVALSRCVFPGCGMPSSRCDLDHRIPYDHGDPAAGGPTCSCNLQPLCRRHHRLKTTGLIRVEPLSPAGGGGEDAPSAWLGSLRWTSRAGLTYTSTPAPVVQPAVPQQAEALRDALYELRHPDPEPLIRLNQKLAEALGSRRAKADDDVDPWRHEIWTETIDRPDHDGLDPDRDPDLAELHDPFADLPF